ncbi:hypothetical protein FALBO_5121 [Fusarium albosuccineum]|uniref:Uncharacterized protein n=1 Tax=Fusarium albosuccineum TaxID=1237068 RepID=A0A8H4PFS0_9HYPO|nr:hypothetical protein FALBO_5121 [Fusarium albosuccineum]
MNPVEITAIISAAVLYLVITAVFPARKLFIYATHKAPRLQAHAGSMGLTVVAAFILSLLWPAAIVCGVWRPYISAHLPSDRGAVDGTNTIQARSSSTRHSSPWKQIQTGFRRIGSRPEEPSADAGSQIATRAQEEVQPGFARAMDWQQTREASLPDSNAGVEPVHYVHQACQTTQGPPPYHPTPETVDKAAIPDGYCPPPPYVA